MVSRIIKEFQDFISRGNVIDLAIGVIIGSAFGKIVNSLVNDIIMPPIGLLLKGIDFKNLFISLDNHHYNTLEAAQRAGAATINYGKFIAVIIEFTIISGCIFILIQAINSIKRNSKISLATPSTKSEKLLTEIRDLLKSSQQK